MKFNGKLVFVFFVMFILMTACKEKEKLIIENPVYNATISEDLNTSMVDFGFDIFKEINKNHVKENVFISPYSISAALGMTYNGAGGETKADMAKALNLEDMMDNEFNEGHKYMYDYLNNMSGVNIEISNAIWLRDNYEVKPEFISQNIEVFDAYVDQLDFDKKSSVKKMNEWIFEKTHEKITDMIEYPVDKFTQMFLANTVYFYGDWEFDFREEFTSDDAFNNSDGTTSTVKMMLQHTDFDYNATEEYRAVKLPYKDSDVAMYCLMPEGELEINDLVNTLNTDKWNEIKDELEPTHKVQLKMPKYKLEFGVEELEESLTALGMGSAFNGNIADFSDISDGIFIGSIKHKAVIEVDEKGSEAAAVTLEEMKEEEAEVEVIPTFFADRPFLIIIEDTKTDSILFLGKIEKF